MYLKYEVCANEPDFRAQALGHPPHPACPHALPILGGEDRVRGNVGLVVHIRQAANLNPIESLRYE